MRSTYIAALAALSILAVTAGAGHGAVPASAPGPIPCDTATMDAPPPSVPECVVAGRVFCSEYGSRFRDLLELVLVNGEERYSSGVSDTNGTFAMRLPCGRSYTMRLEFRGKGIDIGEVDLPESCSDNVFRLRIVHTGSYLELVRDARNEIAEDDITFELVPPVEAAP